LLISAVTTKNISEPTRRQPKIFSPARPSLSSHRPPILVHSIQNLSLSPFLQLSRSPLLRDKDGEEAPLRGSISREAAAALPSSSPSAAALLPSSPTSTMAKGGTVAHKRADHDTTCRYPADQVPPRTSSRSKQKARHANHMLPRVINLSMNHTARGSSRVAVCPAAPAPVVQPGAAPGSSRVLRLQLPLPVPGQLRSRHMSCGSSSRCPARGSSRVTTCPMAPAPAAQPGVAPESPCVLRLQLPLPSPRQLRGRHVCLGGPTVGVLLK
jgi:hypothetical protein